MPVFRVTGQVTISCYVDIAAETEERAKRLAVDAPMQTFCNSCASGDDGAWSTSGELDGTPTVLSVEKGSP